MHRALLRQRGGVSRGSLERSTTAVLPQDRKGQHAPQARRYFVLARSLKVGWWSTQCKNAELIHLNHSREIEENEQEELDIVDEVLEEKAEVTTKLIHKRRPLRLRRKKTIITGIDVAEVDVEDDKEVKKS